MKTKTKKLGVISACSIALATGLLFLSSCQKEDLAQDLEQTEEVGTPTQAPTEPNERTSGMESLATEPELGQIDESNGHDEVTSDGRAVVCSISSYSTVWSSQGGGLYANEAQKELPTGYFLTGVGLTVTDNNVVTLMVRGRKLNSTCTWSSQVEYRAGTNPYGALEKSYSVPAGYAITGIQWGVHDSNVSRLVVKYRALVQQADGSRRLGGTQYTYDSGGNVIEGGLLVSSFGYDYSRTVFGGFGALCHDSNVYQTWAKMRRINP